MDINSGGGDNIRGSDLKGSGFRVIKIGRDRRVSRFRQGQFVLTKPNR